MQRSSKTWIGLYAAERSPQSYWTRSSGNGNPWCREVERARGSFHKSGWIDNGRKICGLYLCEWIVWTVTVYAPLVYDVKQKTDLNLMLISAVAESVSRHPPISTSGPQTALQFLFQSASQIISQRTPQLHFPWAVAQTVVQNPLWPFVLEVF